MKNTTFEEFFRCMAYLGFICKLYMTVGGKNIGIRKSEFIQDSEKACKKSERIIKSEGPPPSTPFACMEIWKFTFI